MTEYNNDKATDLSADNWSLDEVEKVLLISTSASVVIKRTHVSSDAACVYHPSAREAHHDESEDQHDGNMVRESPHIPVLDARDNRNNK